MDGQVGGEIGYLGYDEKGEGQVRMWLMDRCFCWAANLDGAGGLFMNFFLFLLFIGSTGSLTRARRIMATRNRGRVT